MPGKFIVFEGLDGSGESTQVKMLGEYFTSRGKEVFFGKEPTQSNEFGREIIEVLTHKKSMEPRALQELFVRDREEHLKREIEPALQKGAVVLEDRYILSTLAFGSIDCPLDWLQNLNEGLLSADLTFILKVRPEVSIQRIAGRGKPAEFFEKEEKLRKVAATYDKLASMYPRCFIIDGEQPPEKVHEDIVKIVENAL